MGTNRRTIDRLARQAGRRTITRSTAANLADALGELEALTVDALTWPPPQADGFLAELEALTADVERIVTRARR